MPLVSPITNLPIGRDDRDLEEHITSIWPTIIPSIPTTDVMFGYSLENLTKGGKSIVFRVRPLFKQGPWMDSGHHIRDYQSTVRIELGIRSARGISEHNMRPPEIETVQLALQDYFGDNPQALYATKGIHEIRYISEQFLDPDQKDNRYMYVMTVDLHWRAVRVP